MYRIAIDGPCASGKTEIANMLSSKLEILSVDTGAIYRAIALYCLENNVDIHDSKSIVRGLKNIDINIDNTMVMLNGKDVTKGIRTNKVSAASAIVAQNTDVREFVTAIQRRIAENQSVVMQGRDITSVVLPDAELKIYLDANIEERANRRYKELAMYDTGISLDDVKSDIAKRDILDTTRAISPLIKTEDAIYLDTTKLTREEVVNKIVQLLEEREII